jgi:tetratricopeptide (TPR) repeat protein
MPSRTRLRTMTLVACVATAGAAAAAQPALAGETPPANVAAARRHFEKARAYYGQGEYREAISELEAAHALDPAAKDLVFNLGVVHEKLADIDEALKWFRLYTTMSLTPQERERADAYVRRLEGAKKELEAKQAAQQQALAQQQQQAQEQQQAQASASTASPPPPLSEPLRHGRIDGFTILGASLTVADLAFASVMGAKALHDNPSGTPVTGPGQTYPTYADLVNQHDTAHAEAMVSDIAFGAAAVLAGVTAYLYFARTRDPSAAPATGSTSVSVAPWTGGGAVFVQGSF